MDSQQEVFSAMLVALKKHFEDTSIGVYDTFLPPEGTAYPFVYLADSQLVDDYGNKTMILGSIYQTIHVWHDNARKRGTVSSILNDIKQVTRSLDRTKNYALTIASIDQRILPDTSTSTPLLHGILEIEFRITGGTK